MKVMMMVHNPPIEGWKANPTSREEFDWALHPSNAEPDVNSLNHTELQDLLERYQWIEVSGDTHGRPVVYVMDPDAGGDDAQ